MIKLNYFILFPLAIIFCIMDKGQGLLKLVLY